MIRDAEVLVLSHRLTTRRVFGTGHNDTRDAVIVRLEDEDGLVGWGETYRAAGATAAATAIARDLVGLDAERAAERLAAWPDPHRWALAAVSMAVDDLRARIRGVSMAALYGGPVRERVEAYASSRGYVAGMTPAEAWTDEARRSWDDGFRAIKLRIGRHDLDDELAAIGTAVANGPALTWMADGNGAYDLDQSRRLGAALDDLGFRWLEEPLPTADYPAYAPLAAELEIPLAGGEMVESAGEAVPYLAAGAFDLIQPDVAICGGVDGILGIAAEAAAVGRHTVPHACGGAIALAATLQVLAVLPAAPDAPPWAAPILEHDVGENPIRTDLLRDPLVPVDGWMPIPVGPGLGVEVDEDAVRRLVVSPTAAD